MSAVAIPKPEYRALMLFDHLPPGCIAHLVTDAYSAPHIRPGEFIVVDTNDREVRHLETYVIEWQGGRRNVCEAVSREFNWSNPNLPKRGWSVRSISGLRGKAAINAIEAVAGRDQTTEVRGLAWSEGPYRSDDGYLESKLVGCVIGIYAPSEEGPLRLIGGDA